MAVDEGEDEDEDAVISTRRRYIRFGSYEAAG